MNTLFGSKRDLEIEPSPTWERQGGYGRGGDRVSVVIKNCGAVIKDKDVVRVQERFGDRTLAHLGGKEGSRGWAERRLAVGSKG